VCFCALPRPKPVTHLESGDQVRRDFCGRDVFLRAHRRRGNGAIPGDGDSHIGRHTPKGLNSGRNVANLVRKDTLASQPSLPRQGDATMNRTVLALLVSLAVLGCGGSTDPGGSGGTGTRPASLLIVSGDTQVASVGSELPTALVVRVLDSTGSPVAGQAINFRVVAGGGTVFAGVGTTNSNGMAQERWTMGTAPGPQTLEARAVDSTTGAAIVFGTFTATAVAGPVASVTAHVGDGQTGLPTTVLPTPIKVLVSDPYNNPMPGTSVTFVATSGGGAASPATVPTDSQGVASTSWTLGPVSGPQTLEARVTGVPATVFHATAFAESVQFQGTWLSSRCGGPIPGGPPTPPGPSFQKAQFSVSGTAMVVTVRTYLDPACTSLIATDNGTGTLTVGNAVSVAMGSSFVTGYQIDQALTFGGPSSTTYTLGHVDTAATPNLLYLGLLDATSDGSTPAKRPATIDPSTWWVKQ
jgi:hypothetical protein